MVNIVYDQGEGNLSNLVLRLVNEDDNIYIRKIAMGEKVNSEIEHALKRDLLILNNLANSHGRDLIGNNLTTMNLPDWEISNTDLYRSYRKTIQNVNKLGYGIFAKYNVFRIKNGELYHVSNPDPQSMNELYGYENNKQKLYDNTKAFLKNVKASNALLYGSAGTGKSSTVKAVCNSLFSDGLRLVELDPEQIAFLPDIMEELSKTSLKFIIFIDDLSFEKADEKYCILKGILEGKSSSYNSNTLIYATSNRRHLLNESHSERLSDSIHMADTLQENMSLASRFGLTITYLNPNKDEYINILLELLKETDLNISKDELIFGAEAFAIRKNGRSPRTAKQYIEKLLVENMNN
ncbi:MAG TPA: DUF815 domain-containing protein [Anaerovoracaceae bacterium]|nr:DUF815 domain-containing protein [Anaerovoracaceae bacterium]